MEIALPYRDHKRPLWLLSLFVPILGLIGPALYLLVSPSEFWLWLSPLFFYFGIPLLDALIGEDPSNPPESEVPALEADPALLALLQAEAGNKLTDLGDRIVISHLYIERRMVPLNLWLEQVNGQALRDAVEEYGNAIRQLAAANIFPGDMLFKNFGVTRHGRVVFYDYDEICYMTEVNFREIPPPRYPEDELASEPWYSVSPGDVFPEEFRHWLCADPRIGPLFEEMHADLLRADYWRALQMRIKNGHVEDVYAYRRKQRFSVRYGADSRPDKAFTPPSGKVRRSA